VGAAGSGLPSSLGWDGNFILIRSELPAAGGDSIPPGGGTLPAFAKGFIVGDQ
jgi:hypothetical protein